MQVLVRERIKDSLPFLCFSLALLTTILITDAAWITELHAQFDKTSLWMDFLTTCIFLGGSALMWWFPLTSRIGKASLCITVLFAFPFPMVLLNEAILTKQAPMVDAMLAHWDAQLGFDWLAWRAIFVGHPLLNSFLSLVYNSTIVQVVTLTVSLGALSRFRDVERLIITLILGALATAIFGGCTPALGPYLFYGLGDPTGTASLVKTIYNNQSMVVDLSAFKGTVTFPSFHTAMSVAFVIAAWPVWWLRFPFLILNAAMLIAIPLNGAHYFVDMIAGASLTIVVDFLVRVVMARKRPSTAEPALSAS